MEKQTFSITIDAARETVWNILWSDATYPQWTAAFSEGSRAESDWQEGSKVFFLGKENEGMVAIIAAKIPNEFMSFKHIGMVKDGVEDLDSEQTREWAGSLENYTLKTVAGQTELTVEMDIADAYKDDFGKIWPLALERVKELAEQQ